MSFNSTQQNNELPFKPFSIMGILNITPDSFSDGGLFLKPSESRRKIESLIAQGADIVDIGAESSRPESARISESEEWSRLESTLKLLPDLKKRYPKVLFSLDTYKPNIMLHAAKMGVRMINNILGVADPTTMRKLAQFEGMHYLAMNAGGDSVEKIHKKTEGANSILATTRRRFSQFQESIEEAGFSKDRIWLDPGVGFNKSDQANIRLMLATSELSHQFQLTLGVSRKSWIGRLFDIPVPSERDNISQMTELFLSQLGAKIIRTHNVERLNTLRSSIGANTLHG